jgi:hypothetical protein
MVEIPSRAAQMNETVLVDQIKYAGPGAPVTEPEAICRASLHSRMAKKGGTT